MMASPPLQEMLADFEADHQQWESMQGEANTRKIRAVFQTSILQWRVLLTRAKSRAFYSWMHLAIFKSMEQLDVTSVMDLRANMLDLQAELQGDKKGLEAQFQQLQQELSKSAKG